MHNVGRFNEATFQTPPGYEDHSQGYSRVTLVDDSVGSVHLGQGVCQLVPGGTLDPHIHSFEEGFFILEGHVVGSVDGWAYRFVPGDYGVIPVGVAHSWRNIDSRPVRWLEMLTPQPKPAGQGNDTYFLKSGTAPTEANPPDLQDPRTRYLGHFDEMQLPPPSQLQMDGYRGSNVHGISLKMLMDRMLGAQHMTFFIVEFQPGGEGNVHDHPFEESYFILSGEAEAILDGERYKVGPKDIVWTSVGGTHGFFNKGTVPVRWLETQAPQPPAQQAFRFKSDWEYLSEKLGH